MNQLVTFVTDPRIVPKLEFRERGIPEEWRTAVVVPTLLGSTDAAREAIEHLEVQFLANRDPHLHFALARVGVLPAWEADGADDLVDVAADALYESQRAVRLHFTACVCQIG